MRSNLRLLACTLILLSVQIPPASGQDVGRQGAAPSNRARLEDAREYGRLTEAVLQENWQGVLSACESIAAEAESPVLTALRGHALLALNRNNESLEHFVAFEDSLKKSAWEQWTDKSLVSWPSRGVAHYLRGDALARLGKWNEAVKEYSQALRLSPDHALALNARGVAYAYLDSTASALRDFEGAVRIDSTLADAYANLGTFLVYREAPEGALENYEHALALSPGFCLGRNGMACARLGYRADSTSICEALRDLALASGCPVVHVLAERNLERIQEIAARRVGVDSLASSQGFTMNTRDLFNAPGSIRQDQMGQMSDRALLDTYNSASKNATHSQWWAGAWAGASGQVMGTGGNLSGLSKTSWKDYERWSGVAVDARAELQRRGLDVNQGGATTKDLENEYADFGSWPLRTLFGLLQSSVPPTWSTNDGGNVR